MARLRVRSPGCGDMKTVTVKIAPGLTRPEARRRAWAKARRRGKRDYRAFTYNRATGRASFT